MHSATFLCPRTGIHVPRPAADPSADPSTYDYLSCPACKTGHLVHVGSGRLASEMAVDQKKV
jgi:hypothetical protein